MTSNLDELQTSQTPVLNFHNWGKDDETPRQKQKALEEEEESDGFFLISKKISFFSQLFF